MSTNKILYFIPHKMTLISNKTVAYNKIMMEIFLKKYQVFKMKLTNVKINHFLFHNKIHFVLINFRRIQFYSYKIKTNINNKYFHKTYIWKNCQFNNNNSKTLMKINYNNFHFKKITK